MEAQTKEVIPILSTKTIRSNYSCPHCGVGKVFIETASHNTPITTYSYHCLNCQKELKGKDLT